MNDQPAIFDTTILTATSTRADDDMRFGELSDAVVAQHRAVFLERYGISMKQSVLVKIDYSNTDFAEYKQVSRQDGGRGMADLSRAIFADALVTTESDVALFLPLADCVGAVLYDSARRVLMLSHLGRHSIEQFGAEKSVAYLAESYDSNTSDIKVWLSPAAGKKNYPLRAFGGRGMQEVVCEQLQQAGILPENIEVSPVDTTASPGYYSHSEYLKSNQKNDGRFAVVAMMRDQGEPVS